MEQDLINQEYLQELRHVAQDQDEHDLVSQLFERLLQNSELFLSQAAELLNDEKKLQFELHKLKNQFANLGCVAASHLLEEMYQLARQQQIQEVKAKLQEFRQLSENTFKQLQSELSH